MVSGLDRTKMIEETDGLGEREGSPGSSVLMTFVGSEDAREIWVRWCDSDAEVQGF